MKLRHIRKAEKLRNRVVTDRLRIPPDWVPTPRNISALPRPLRDYIMRMEARDPQHSIKKIAMLQDFIRMIEADNERFRRMVAWQRKEIERYRELVDQISGKTGQ